MDAAFVDWRPRVHFAAARHWINDPNGLVWHDGEWHLFFQHNPQGDTWGHMSWGHAVSSDLLHWQELPLAIPEDAQWMIFSGCVVIDDGTMVACYTGHAQAGGHQAQMLAHSRDRGRTWTKYAGNPVLDIGEADFRDPKVFRHDGRWIMLVSMAMAGALRFYASDDLVHWRFLSEFGLPSLARNLPWECPDLLSLPVAGEGREAWLLKFDVFEGHPGGGSGAVGVVGAFDGTQFVAHQPPQWLDGGMDFYAAIAFNAMPPGDDRRLWMGWMNDHHYAKHTPTAPWRGAMTLPREVSLVRTAAGLRVAQQPLRELNTLRGAPIEVPACDLPAGGLDLVPAGILPPSHDLEIEVEAECWQLQVRVGETERTLITVDAGTGELSIDRRASGHDAGAGGYAGVRRIAWRGDALRVVVDACSVEVFAGDGLASITELVFPQPGSSGIRLVADGPGRLRRFMAWPLAAAMPARDPAP